MYSTAYNLWTLIWFVHFELPFRLKGTDKIHTEGLSKFHSNIYSILFGYNWRGPPYHMNMHAFQTAFHLCKKYSELVNCIRGNCTSDKYFLFKWSTGLQSMYNHIVGRATSVLSPLYSILLGLIQSIFKWMFKMINSKHKL